VAYGKSEESLTGEPKAQMHARGRRQLTEIRERISSHPESAQVLTRAATDLYAVKDYPRAVAAAQTLLARQPPVDQPKQRIAWTVVANSEFEQGEFAKAEAGYNSAQALMPPNDPERAVIVERLAAAIYKQGEQKK